MQSLFDFNLFIQLLIFWNDAQINDDLIITSRKRTRKLGILLIFRPS